MAIYFDGVEQAAELTRGDECDVPGWSNTYYFTKSVSTVAPDCPANETTCEVWLDTYQCDEYDTEVNSTDDDWNVFCAEPDPVVDPACDSKVYSFNRVSASFDISSRIIRIHTVCTNCNLEAA